MAKRIRLTVSHFRPSQPGQPAIKPMAAWFQANRGFYDNFRAWLRAGGYGESALSLYSVAVRLALGLLDQPYWLLDPQTGLEPVRRYIIHHYPNPGTQQSYFKGLAKLAQYLRLRQRRPPEPKPLNWTYYLSGLPEALAGPVRDYLAHCQRGWLPEQRHRASLDHLSQLTRSLRWLAQHAPLTGPGDLTPTHWFDYLDTRLAEQITARTLNGELFHLQGFLRFVQELGQPVDSRMLRVEPLKEGPALPKDVPLAHLRRLQTQIEHAAASAHAGIRRLGLMDKAWFLFMLHSGLRTGEIRRLRLADLELAAQRVRIEQSKGLKDRLVCLSQPALAAIEAYLEVRGPATPGAEHVFLYRHQPLSVSYCLERLKTYGQQCGVVVTPHQLRHSCATLLLNAGAPILTVQTILGHKYIDTTLGYARLYDGTVAADYYRAMGQIERQLALAEVTEQPTTPAHLLALVDTLRKGTLNEAQQETIQHLRQAILTLAETENIDLSFDPPAGSG